MQPPKPPKITGVEVIAAQPTEADRAAIAHLSAQSNRSLPQVVHVVKVRLQTKPPATSMAWALYVNDVLIPKSWEYDEGIYFTCSTRSFSPTTKESGCASRTERSRLPRHRHEASRANCTGNGVKIQ